MIRRRAFAISLSALLALAGGAGVAAGLRATTEPGSNLVQVAQEAGSFKTLLAAARAAGLADTLAGSGPLTVFAPTDEAFSALGRDTISELLKPENKARLAEILAYHVVPGRVSAADALRLNAAETANGQRLAIAVKNGRLTVDQVNVVQTDIPASNGVIHVVDRVLMPATRTIPEQAQRLHLNTLIAAVKAAGLADVLSGPGPFTVLAPSDEAFKNLPPGTLDSLLKPENKAQLAEILKLHVLSGRVFADFAVRSGTLASLRGEPLDVSLTDGRLRVGGAAVTRADVDAANGVVHVIDRVLLPKSADAATGDRRVMMSMGTGTDATPRQLIELAIERGVPLFNRGDQDACVAVYDLATAALLARPDVSDTAKQALRNAVKKAAAADGDADKAWALREGLDAALITTNR